MRASIGLLAEFANEWLATRPNAQRAVFSGAVQGHLDNIERGLKEYEELIKSETKSFANS